ncbi:MAG TPA: PQQ-binding-like beta-propeller repeat protein, partial [Verrucomicrobiae bacterium]
MSNFALVNLAGNLALDASAFNLADGSPGPVLKGLAAHAVDQDGNVIGASRLGAVYSCRIFPVQTNWVHVFATVADFSGNPLAIDQAGQIHLAARAADTNGALAAHYILDPATGNTLQTTGTPPRLPGPGAGIAISDTGDTLVALGGGQVYYDDQTILGSGSAVASAFDETGIGYVSSPTTFGGFFRVNAGAIQQRHEKYGDFVLVDANTVVAATNSILRCFFPGSDNTKWMLTNAAAVNQVPLPVSTDAVICLMNDGVSVLDLATGNLIRHLSDSEVFVPGANGACRFAVDQQGVLLVASTAGFGAFDIHDLIDPQYVSEGNGCWHRYGAGGRNTQQQPKLMLGTNVLGTVRLLKASHFSASDAKGNIYIADAAGVACLDAQTLQIRWRKPDVTVASDLIADESGLYYCGRDGILNKRDRTNGTIVWQYTENPTPRPAQAVLFNYLTPFAADENSLYAVDSQGQLSSWSKVNGLLRWSRLLGDLGTGRLAIGPNHQIFAASLDGYLSSFDGGTGTLLWRSFLGDGVYAHLGVALAPDGRLMIPTYDGSVLFASPFDGEVMGSLPLPGPVVSIPVLDDSGRLFAAINQSGSFSVVRADSGGGQAVLYSGQGWLSGQIHLLGGHDLLVSDVFGASATVPVDGGSLSSQFPVPVRTLDGWRQLSGDVFLMDGNRLQLRRINPQGQTELSVRSSIGPADNSGYWKNNTSPVVAGLPKAYTLGPGNQLVL